MPTLDEGDARRRFAAARVARLATVDRGGTRSRQGSTPIGEPDQGLVRPHLVPVVFAVDGDEILMAVDAKPKRHRDLKRLRNIGDDPAVSLLVDHYSDDWSHLWWVRADGEATVDDGEGTLERVRAHLGARYAQHRDDPPAGPAIVVAVRRWSGWAASGDA